MYISADPTCVAVGNTKFLCPVCKFAAVFQGKRKHDDCVLVGNLNDALGRPCCDGKGVWSIVKD